MKIVKRLPKNSKFQYIDLFGERVYTTKKRIYFVSKLNGRKVIRSYSKKEYEKYY